MIFRFKKLLTTLALGMAFLACSTASAKERWEGFWLPEGVSSYSSSVDNLFYFVLVLTGVVFIATEGCLLVFIWKYRKQEGQKSFYTHGNHTLEMIWTITPAVTLIFIALIQARTWNEIKDPSGFVDKDPKSTIDDYVHVQLFAEQFSWFFRYPAIVTDAKTPGKKEYKYGVPGTFTEERMLTVPKNKKIIVEMTSKDVIHSFFLPYMRLKQDVVPGMMIRCWFDASKSTAEMRETRPRMMLRSPGGLNAEGKFEMPLKDMEWDYPIICAELCGIQHYQMWGKVRVLEQNEYDEWCKAERKKFTKDADGNVELEEATNFAHYWQVDPVTQQRIYGKVHEDDPDGFYNKRSALKFEAHHDDGKHDSKHGDETKKPDEHAK